MYAIKVFRDPKEKKGQERLGHFAESKRRSTTHRHPQIYQEIVP